MARRGDGGRSQREARGSRAARYGRRRARSTTARISRLAFTLRAPVRFPLCAIAEAYVRPRWDVVWLSDIAWGSLWQRPQQLATRFPDDTRILFVEPWTLGHPPALRATRVTDRISRVSFPFLPLHARSLGLRRLAYRWGSSGIGVGTLLAFQRSWARTLRGFFRSGAKRLALVQNFMAYPTLRSWRPERIVYDMIDAPLHFAPVPPRLVPYWKSLLADADRVVVTSSPLATLAGEGGATRVSLVGNGVETERFARAEARPDTLPGASGVPVLGYVGSIHAWFDVPLVRALAQGIPNAKVVLVGPAHPATQRELERAAADTANLHWMGPRPYSEIPSIVGAFRVGLIPFRRTPLTEAVNPVKLYEYAAAGVPCVTTRFSDEVDRWAPAARVADGPEEFLREAQTLLAAAPDRAMLRAFAALHDWDAIARHFAAICLEGAA
jgi:glycosyltransferase involved in cell wall biosynthesis